MISQAPEELDGARVLYWCSVSVGQVVSQGQPVSYAAICQYAGTEGYYLFVCNPQWEVIGDTDHQSVEEAAETLRQWCPSVQLQHRDQAL